MSFTKYELPDFHKSACRSSKLQRQHITLEFTEHQIVSYEKTQVHIIHAPSLPHATSSLYSLATASYVSHSLGSAALLLFSDCLPKRYTMRVMLSQPEPRESVATRKSYERCVQKMLSRIVTNAKKDIHSIIPSVFQNEDYTRNSTI